MVSMCKFTCKFTQNMCAQPYYRKLRADLYFLEFCHFSIFRHYYYYCFISINRALANAWATALLAGLSPPALATAATAALDPAVSPLMQELPEAVLLQFRDLPETEVAEHAQREVVRGPRVRALRGSAEIRRGKSCAAGTRSSRRSTTAPEVVEPGSSRGGCWGSTHRPSTSPIGRTWY